MSSCFLFGSRPPARQEGCWISQRSGVGGKKPIGVCSIVGTYTQWFLKKLETRRIPATAR